MSGNTFIMAMTIALTTTFWLIFMAVHSPRPVDDYRQGYAECKAGMESRYEIKQK